MDYLEEIDWELEALNLPAGDTEEVQRLIEKAFCDGLDRSKPVDPLKGYSNLTEAISAGEPIDWERLDGLASKCVHPELGTLRGKLERDSECPVNHMDGWWSLDMDASYFNAFVKAWHGKDGWTLWLEGEIPMRRKTADQLEVGTYFTGARIKKEWLMYVGEDPIGESRVIYYAPKMIDSLSPASEWEVIEEHGPFQKPEGE